MPANKRLSVDQERQGKTVGSCMITADIVILCLREKINCKGEAYAFNSGIYNINNLIHLPSESAISFA